MVIKYEVIENQTKGVSLIQALNINKLSGPQTMCSVEFSILVEIPKEMTRRKVILKTKVTRVITIIYGTVHQQNLDKRPSSEENKYHRKFFLFSF